MNGEIKRGQTILLSEVPIGSRLTEASGRKWLVSRVKGRIDIEAQPLMVNIDDPEDMDYASALFFREDTRVLVTRVYTKGNWIRINGTLLPRNRNCQ